MMAGKVKMCWKREKKWHMAMKTKNINNKSWVYVAS